MRGVARDEGFANGIRSTGLNLPSPPDLELYQGLCRDDNRRPAVTPGNRSESRKKKKRKKKKNNVPTRNSRKIKTRKR